jgi:dephospho-CoA kinase
LERHDWIISRSRVEELADCASDRTVFLCGSPSNDRDVWDLFSDVICLVVDDETLRRRMGQRTSNDFGKASDELEVILRWNATNETQYRHLGATIIDASKPLEDVVDEVLAVVR